MERVKEGEKYWFIETTDYGHISWAFDFEDKTRWGYDRAQEGNYFYTQEEAEAMARKLRAVFKGADVIEMPSVDEVINRLPNAAGYAQNTQLSGYRHGYCNCYELLKSKIVK